MKVVWNVFFQQSPVSQFLKIIHRCVCSFMLVAHTNRFIKSSVSVCCVCPTVFSKILASAECAISLNAQKHVCSRQIYLRACRCFHLWPFTEEKRRFSGHGVHLIRGSCLCSSQNHSPGLSAANKQRQLHLYAFSCFLTHYWVFVVCFLPKRFKVEKGSS